MTTKTEFIEWKSMRITQEAFADILEVAGEAAATILVRTSVNTDVDQYMKGFIRGIQSLVEWQPDFEEEPQ